jgi:hypothetical protein
MPGLGAIIDGDRAISLGKAPGYPQAYDPGADDDGFRANRRNGSQRGYDGLPSPGMPGQVQWV